IAVDQDAIDAKRVVNSGSQQVFAKTEPNGDVIVGLFNTAASSGVVSVPASAAGLPAAGAYRVDELWSHRSTAAGATISPPVPAHGVALLRVHPTSFAYLLAPATGLAVTGLPGQAVTASFTNSGTQSVRGVTLDLVAPDGWQVAGTSAASFPQVAPGQTVQA